MTLTSRSRAFLSLSHSFSLALSLKDLPFLSRCSRFPFGPDVLANPFRAKTKLPGSPAVYSVSPSRSKGNPPTEFLSKCKRFRSLFRAAAHRLSKETTWIYSPIQRIDRNVRRLLFPRCLEKTRSELSFRRHVQLVSIGRQDRKIARILCPLINRAHRFRQTRLEARSVSFFSFVFLFFFSFF